MTGNPYTSFDPTSLMQGWVKTATEYWQESAKGWMESSEGKAATEFPGADILGRMFRESDAGGELFTGKNLAPQVGLKMAEIWWKGISSLQQAYMKNAAGQPFDIAGLPFAGIDPGAFKAWTDLYEREAWNQFHIPPMGITREYQERTNRVMEAFNRFQSVMAQFLYLTSLPMEKSLQAIREELSAIVNSEMPTEEFKAMYKKWVGALEEKYMALLKSKEYIEVMNKTIEAFGAFNTARSQWLEDYLKAMSVPTQREMDDVFRDLYNLKKEVRELRKTLGKR
jgi:class III poly(R)-hydroxyalkanoic acid synthase PhaE subunit